MVSHVHSQPKDPAAVLEYGLDWSAWLNGDAILSHAVTASGVTVDSSDAADGVVTAWLSGGTAGTQAQITFSITTTGGRTDERTLLLRVRDR